MKPGTIRATAFACACLFATVPAAAQEGAPDVRSEGSIRYVIGGVTTDERSQLTAIARDFNLKLVFAEKSGDYLADVRVVVRAADGREVLAVSADGPILMAKLPAGEYRIAATAGGKEMVRSATVPASGQRELTFRW